MASTREAQKTGAVRVWLLAGGAGCLMLGVLFVGSALMLYFAVRPGGLLGPPLKEGPAPTVVAPGPAAGNAEFQKMAARLTGRWVGELKQGGTIHYDYRADGTFTLDLERPDKAVHIAGTWHVVGVGADSLGIKRTASAERNEFFEPDRTCNVLFPAPDLMQHALANGFVDCAREGSGAKPGKLPSAQRTAKGCRRLAAPRGRCDA